MPSSLPTHRLATAADIPALTRLMNAAIAELQKPFLDPAQMAASHAVMGLDTQLIADGTYFVVEVADGAIIASGGWSRRATLYGGDHSADLRDAALLDPAHDPARVRAMYTHPAHARQGVGRYILTLCEAAASAEGFTATELMATLSGEPLYRACGYAPVERVDAAAVDRVTVPLVRMRKEIA